MLKIDTNLSYDARWYDFETGEVIDEPDAERPALKAFKDALVDMANITGADDKPLPCTDEVKQKIFDFGLAGISQFVFQKIWNFYKAKGVEEKNSSR